MAQLYGNETLYFKNLKTNLVESNILVQCDFAENFSFIVQDATQSFHWNNDQATLLTSVYYFKDGQDLKHGSIVIISSDLKHDTATFYSFQKMLHQHLEKNNILVSKIIYITDGAPQHFKNRFNYKQDFGTDAEFHFHATAHGKGPCDGLGGNLKRLAARASLQLPTDKAITSAKRLYDWAKSSTLQFIFVTKKKSNNKEICYNPVLLLLSPYQALRSSMHLFRPKKDF